MANPLDRTWYNTLVDDDGSGTTGTIWNKAAVDGLLDSVDASLAGVVDKTAAPAALQVAVFTDGDTVKGDPNLTYEGTGLQLRGVSARVDLTDPTGPADQRIMRVINVGGVLALQPLNDVGTATLGISLARSGVLTLDSGRIAFPATQTPSADPTTLDDYREGPWTPVWWGQGGQNGQVYSIQEARYTKTGREVNCRGRLALSNRGTFGAGPVLLAGLPIPSASLQGTGTVHIGYYAGLATPIATLSGFVQLAQTYAQLFYTPAAGATGMSALDQSFVTNATDIIFSLTYQAAA